MRKKTLKTILVLVVLCLFFAGCAAFDKCTPIRVEDYGRVIRVACIGDSITYGARIANREQNSYPARLGQMLGDKWQVRNFGIIGATMLKTGNKPYWQQKAFAEALVFEPDVVIIKLGTNDTKPVNWKYGRQYADDYKKMIDIFAGLPTQPKIWICYPAYVRPGHRNIRESVVVNEQIPAIKKIAYEKDVSIIDLHTPLIGRPEMYVDLVHPNAAGAEILAETVYQALTCEKAMTE